MLPVLRLVVRILLLLLLLWLLMMLLLLLREVRLYVLPVLRVSMGVMFSAGVLEQSGFRVAVHECAIMLCRRLLAIAFMRGGAGGRSPRVRSLTILGRHGGVGALSRGHGLVVDLGLLILLVRVNKIHSTITKTGYICRNALVVVVRT